jgi:hypothetical protein
MTQDRDEAAEEMLAKWLYKVEELMERNGLSLDDARWKGKVSWWRHWKNGETPPEAIYEVTGVRVQ